MDLSVLHPVKAPDRDYSWKDKLNSLTGHPDCQFLEWTGWYNQDIYQRLLGHYRLYQLFKKESKGENGLPQPLAYIVNYRASRSFKYLLSSFTSILYYLGSCGKPYYPLQTEGINLATACKPPIETPYYLTGGYLPFIQQRFKSNLICWAFVLLFQ